MKTEGQTRVTKCLHDFSFLLGLLDDAVTSIDWSSTQLCELDISSTDLSERALLEFFSTVPPLQYLAVPNCDGFTDKVR